MTSKQGESKIILFVQERVRRGTIQCTETQHLLLFLHVSLVADPSADANWVMLSEDACASAYDNEETVVVVTLKEIHTKGNLLEGG